MDVMARLFMINMGIMVGVIYEIGEFTYDFATGGNGSSS